MDFSMVTARLATGAAPTGMEDVSALKNAGITHVIDTQWEIPESGSILAASGMAYLWDPTQDDGEPKEPSWFAAGIEFALPALVLPASKVYVHCLAGSNRGPSMTAAILMAFGLSSGQARDMIHAARPEAEIAYLADAEEAVGALGYAEGWKEGL